MKKLLLLTLLICITLPWSCKKYEEDDYWFTLRTVKNRIKGNKILVEAKNSQRNFLEELQKYFGDFYFEFTTDVIGGLGAYKVYIHDKSTKNVICNACWAFNSIGYKKTQDKSDIYISFTNEHNLYNPCFPESEHPNDAPLGLSGKITKLSNKEIWFFNDGANGKFPTTLLKFETYEP